MGGNHSSATTHITLAQAQDLHNRFARRAADQLQIRTEYAALCTEERRVYEKPENFKTGTKLEALNRYCNVLPFEGTLFPRSSDPHDYFNANMLDASATYGLPIRFIAHQAPTPECIPGFWKSVLETRPPVIVMLTRLNEGGRHKADQYWPPREGEVYTLPNGLTVTNAGTPPSAHAILQQQQQQQQKSASSSAQNSPCKDALNTSNPALQQQQQQNQQTGQQQQPPPAQLQMNMQTPTRAVGPGGVTTSPPPTPGSGDILSTLLIVKPKGLPDDCSQAHRTVLLRYEGWPDHGVPNTTGSVQRLMEDLDVLSLAHQQSQVAAAAAAATSSSSATSVSQPQANAAAAAPPPTVNIFVHCSAGIGRTGTFIGAFIGREQFRRGTFDPERGVFGIVQWLKRMRPGSVQQAEQYSFLYRLILAEMAAGCSLLEARERVKNN